MRRAPPEVQSRFAELKLETVLEVIDRWRVWRWAERANHYKHYPEHKAQDEDPDGGFRLINPAVDWTGPRHDAEQADWKASPERQAFETLIRGLSLVARAELIALMQFGRGLEGKKWERLRLENIGHSKGVAVERAVMYLHKTPLSEYLEFGLLRLAGRRVPRVTWVRKLAA